MTPNNCIFCRYIVDLCRQNVSLFVSYPHWVCHRKTTLAGAKQGFVSCSRALPHRGCLLSRQAQPTTPPCCPDCTISSISQRCMGSMLFSSVISAVTLALLTLLHTSLKLRVMEGMHGWNPLKWEKAWSSLHRLIKASEKCFAKRSEKSILTRPVHRLKTAGYSLLALTCPRKKQWRISLGSCKWDFVSLLCSAPKCVTV